MTTMFCPACGEDVDTFKMLQVNYSPPREESCCSICGLTIEEPEKGKQISGGTILIAEDSKMLQEMLRDVVKNNGLADKVITCDHGVTLITAATELAINKEPAKLMMMDVSMPVLNGINAAIAFRGVEDAFKIIRTPIVFFTGHRCDDKFKKILQYCSPAYYVNKGAISRPDELASRITRVVHKVMDIKEKSGTQK